MYTCSHFLRVLISQYFILFMLYSISYSFFDNSDHTYVKVFFKIVLFTFSREKDKFTCSKLQVLHIGSNLIGTFQDNGATISTSYCHDCGLLDTSKW